MSKLKQPIVNILIPCYNQEGVICQAVESALMQSYDNCKVIISDDNSSDNTLNALEKYKDNPKVVVYCNESNLGRLGNYKKLLYKYCDSEYAVNLDGDDYYLTDKFIEDSMSAILKYDNIVFAVSNQHYGKLDRFNKWRSKKFRMITGEDFVFNFYGISKFTHLGSVYKVSEARKVDFYADNIISSDADSFLKLALLGDVMVRSYKVGMWRKHDLNESTESQIQKKYDNVQVLTGNLTTHVKKNYPQYVDKLPNWRRKITVQYLFPMITRSIIAKNNVESKFVWEKIKMNHKSQFLSWYFPLYAIKRTAQIVFRAIMS